MKIKRKIKKMLNLYNLAIIACLVLIVVALCVIFKPEKKVETSKASNNKEVVQNEKKDNKKDNKKEIKEDKAREIAKKRFEQLGENDVKESELEVKKITRNDENSYFISSANNTLEVRATDGKIIRINSVVVDE